MFQHVLVGSNTATFKVLIGTAAKYWHIDPSKYAMCDTLGILFVRRMGVLEGLRLCPPGTQLKLIPLYDGHHDDDAPHHEGARAAVDLAALVKHRQQDGARQNVAPPQWANDDDEEDEALPAPTVYKRVWFALGDGRMTRCGMFMGVMQTLIAILMLALLICVRWDHSEAQQVCAAHVNLMVDSQFTSHQGYLTSFRDLSSLGHLGAFFKVHMPNVLYGSAADGVMTPLVGGSSVVVGGFRLEQRRSKVIDAARCTSAPFVTSNEPIPYHHQGFTSMVNSHGFSNLTNADILPTPNAVTAQAITTAYINGPRDVNDCYLPIKSETREGLGNDDTEPFAAGSLSLEELVGTRNVATSLPEVKCHEQCSPPRLPGIAGAFVHQSYEQVRLYSLEAAGPVPSNAQTSTSLFRCPRPRACAAQPLPCLEVPCLVMHTINHALRLTSCRVPAQLALPSLANLTALSTVQRLRRGHLLSLSQPTRRASSMTRQLPCWVVISCGWTPKPGPWMCTCHFTTSIPSSWSFFSCVHASARRGALPVSTTVLGQG